MAYSLFHLNENYEFVGHYPKKMILISLGRSKKILILLLDERKDQKAKEYHFRHGTSLLRLHGHFELVHLLQVSKNDDEEHGFLK